MNILNSSLIIPLSLDLSLIPRIHIELLKLIQLYEICKENCVHDLILNFVLPIIKAHSAFYHFLIFFVLFELL